MDWLFTCKCRGRGEEKGKKGKEGGQGGGLLCTRSHKNARSQLLAIKIYYVYPKRHSMKMADYFSCSFFAFLWIKKGKKELYERKHMTRPAVLTLFIYSFV